MFRPIHRIFILDSLLEGVLDESDPWGFCHRYFGELLAVIGMKPLAPLSVSPAADPEAPGFSGMQELTTSHTSFHYFREPGTATGNPNVHIDLYSCAPFSHEEVLSIAHGHFRLDRWTATFIDRALDPLERVTLQLLGEADRITDREMLRYAHEPVVPRHRERRTGERRRLAAAPAL